ncbi:hypothetical protein [Streptomyces sp. NPDC002573]|uniref:hypothetical protein n=1 Tax=Streptomyces sp. NPDC002573 TaxID=3364651 RepID=UPI00368B12C1
MPSGVAAADLIALGASEYGDLYLHRHDGSVHIWSGLEGPTDRTLVPLAPDLDVFTRILEAVHRYSNACWHRTCGCSGNSVTPFRWKRSLVSTTRFFRPRPFPRVLVPLAGLPGHTSQEPRALRTCREQRLRADAAMLPAGHPDLSEMYG